MNRTVVIAPLAMALQLTASVSWAEPLSTYVAECKSALNLDRIPGYSCTDGISVPSAAGLNVSSANNYIGRVDTGNPDVDAVFLCRSVNLATNQAGLNGYILQNRVTGRICFFDARENTIARDLPDVDSANASVNWEDPEGMAGQCQNCHSNDPFIVTEPLAFPFRELGLLYGNRNYLGPYRIVSTNDSSSHFFGWEDDAKALWQANSCANSCHRMADDRITTISNTLLAANLMPPPSGSDYDDIPPSSVIMEAIW